MQPVSTPIGPDTQGETILKKYSNPLLFQKLSNCIKSFEVPNYKFLKNAISFFLENQLNVGYDEKYKINNNNSFIYQNKLNKKSKISSIDILFNKEGIISKKLINYEFRKSQLDFAYDIDKIILNNGYLIAEAGAGLGKSYAYLFGSLLNKGQNNTQIIISTNTHSLQAQLFEKDIPFVLDVLNLDLQRHQCKEYLLNDLLLVQLVLR